MATENIDLRQRRAKAIADARAIVERAEAENRNTTAEEDEQYDRAMADADDLLKRAQRIEGLAEQEASLVAAQRETPTPASEGDADILRKIASGELRGYEFRPSAAMRHAADPSERRTMTGTGDTGAPIVASLYDRIMTHLVETGPMWRTSTVINTDRGETLDFPSTSSWQTATIKAEKSASDNSEMTMAAFVALGAFRYSFYSQVSEELLNDSAIPLLDILAQGAATAIAVKTGTDFTVGAGTTLPWGIVAQSSLGKTGGAGVTGAFTADDLIDLYYSVVAPYRNQPGAGWMLRDASIAAVRKLKDTAGQYIFAPALAAGAPDTLLGKPIYPNPDVVATALSAKSVIFGDLSRYYIRTVGGIRFERSDDFAFTSHLVTFRCMLRADGNLVDQTGAVKHFIGNAV